MHRKGLMHAPRQALQSAVVGQTTHLKQTVSMSVQGALELQHIAVLLWIYVLIRKVHSEPVQDKLHGCCREYSRLGRV